MTKQDKNKLELSIHQAINLRSKGDRVAQEIIDNAHIMRALGSTWATVSEACKIGEATISKIRKNMRGYGASETALQYIEDVRNERMTVLNDTTNWVVDGRLKQAQNIALNFLTSDEFMAQLPDNPMLALKMLDMAHKFTTAERKLLIEREKVRVEEKASEATNPIYDLIEALKGGNQNES